MTALPIPLIQPQLHTHQGTSQPNLKENTHRLLWIGVELGQAKASVRVGLCVGVRMVFDDEEMHLHTYIRTHPYSG